MNRLTRDALLAAAAVLLPVTCRAQGREPATRAPEFQCGGSLPRTSSAVATMTKDQACTLVATALRALAALRPQEGRPDPADTGVVSAARIHEVTEVSMNGADTVGTWWTVTLRLPPRPYDVEVRIDKSDGRASEVRKIHKPFVEPRN